jgi:hypothetical protein
MRERGYSLGNLDATIIAEVAQHIYSYMAPAEISSSPLICEGVIAGQAHQEGLAHHQRGSLHAPQLTRAHFRSCSGRSCRR